MNTAASTPIINDAQQILASALAHQVERMSKEEVQALVAKGQLELQNENAVLKQRVAQLESDRLKLLYQLERSRVSEEDFADFDPAEYTVPVEEMLNNAKRRLSQA